MSFISRRDFVKNTAVASLGFAAMPLTIKTSKSKYDKVRIGIIGTGNRGTGLLRNLLRIEDCEVVAVCDLFRTRAENAANLCDKAGKPRPAVYGKDENTWKQMLDKEKIDTVIIATYWEWHVPMTLYAMKKKIIPGVEVPAALTVNDLWKLVNTSEELKIPFMMLENWSFRQDNLALLNMKRLGMLGDIVHCHCAHSHDCIDHWFFDSKTGDRRWPAKYLLEYNRDQYPTHSLGPVLSWLDINRGDVFTEIYSTATASTGINAYMKRKFGENHPNAKTKWKQGDIVTSLIKTKKGKTVVVNYDMQLPRPYANRWMLQGLEGVYDEEKNSIYLVNKSPEYHQWEPWKPYEEKYNHKFWGQKSEGTHGGADFVMLTQFVKAIREKNPLPIDIYDSAVMSAVVELSGISIANNKPVPFPDFTRGKWEVSQPYFALDQSR